MPRFKASLIIAVCSVIIASAASADAPDGKQSFGRLPNGKAYRVDAQGYQLVDQIAELEVENDTLKRRVTSLEDQLSGKEKSAATITPATAASPSQSCESQTTPLQNEITRLNGELRSSNDKLQNANAQLRSVSESSTDSAAREASLRQDSQQLQSELAQVKLQLQKAPSADVVRAKDEQVARLQQQLEQAREQLSEKDDRVSQLQAKLSDAETTLQKTTAGYEAELKLAHSELDRTNARIENSEKQDIKRASLATPENDKASKEKDSTDEAPVATLRAPEITSPAELSAARKKLGVYLANIQSLILERKNIYDTLKGKGTNVSINLQPLKAKSGESLDTLRAKTQSANNGEEIASIGSGLSDIEQILRDDIQVMKRVGHI